jgi:hypothetical protein
LKYIWSERKRIAVASKLFDEQGPTDKNKRRILKQEIEVYHKEE